MIITKWTDGKGNFNITIKYAGVSRTFTNERDADDFRKQIENKILNLA